MVFEQPKHIRVPRYLIKIIYEFIVQNVYSPEDQKNIDKYA
ncbi:MAG: hypothetical protein CM15mP111_2280 [Hyphomicrobiales bacterium]|nr:MAG: hypothetical protein CM15mP111_2280 [Hyphomicrobiales bacterium]